MTTENKPVRVRLAPSPTGYVHIGTLRTALFDFLFARHTGGSVILRIEDTDQNRFVEGAIENMLKVFKELGINFDEGYFLDDNNEIKEKGSFGPYLQSKRLDLYHKHVNDLLEKGSAYYCFCSEQRIDELRKEQTALKKPPMYDRHCRNLSQEEITKLRESFKLEGKNPVVRQAMPLEGQTVIHDLIYGDITYDHKILDDQILLKSDNFPTYHLAVVVDDHFMEISHVIRGDEWIPSTPKHILLYEAFGWEPTLFAHTPLILNPDKSKLSKRQGDVAVEDFLNKGYLKEALLNFVAFLGWNPKSEKEIFSLDELIEQFEINNINKSGAVFDIQKLDWINGLYIRQMDRTNLAEALIPYWKKSGVAIENYNNTYLQEIASLEQDRLKKLSEIGERTGYFFQEPEYDKQILMWKKSDLNDAKQKLTEIKEVLSSIPEENFTNDYLETTIKSFIQEKGYDNGSVLWPLRTSLTGLPASPGPFEVASTLALGLGKNAIIQRIQTAISKI